MTEETLEVRLEFIPPAQGSGEYVGVRVGVYLPAAAKKEQDKGEEPIARTAYRRGMPGMCGCAI